MKQGHTPSLRLIVGPLFKIHTSNIGRKRVLRIGVCKQTTNTQKDLTDCECRRPLRLKNIEANHSCGVDIWMKDLRQKLDVRGLERIIHRELNTELEDTASVRTVLRTHNDSLPLVEVVSYRTCTTTCRWVSPQICDFLVDTTECHSFLEVVGEFAPSNFSVLE